MRTASAILLLTVACTAPGRAPEQPASSAPTQVRWRTLAAMPTPRTEVAATLAQDEIVVAGGFSATGDTVSTVETYSPSDDEWRTSPELPHAVNHAMAATDVAARAYVLGGYRRGLRRPSDRGFVLVGAGWQELPRMPEPRAAGGAVVAGGKIYVVGGVGPSGLAETTLVLDPVERRWTEAPGLPHPREHLGVAAFDERIYVVGGRTGDGNLGTTEVFDPASGRWSALPDMPTARGGLAAAATRGGLVVAPGGEEAGGTFEEVEGFDIDAGRWVALPPLPTPRHGLGVVTVGDVVYVIAGGPTPGLDVSGATEALDLAPLG